MIHDQYLLIQYFIKWLDIVYFYLWYLIVVTSKEYLIITEETAFIFIKYLCPSRRFITMIFNYFLWKGRRTITKTPLIRLDTNQHLLYPTWSSRVLRSWTTCGYFECSDIENTVFCHLHMNSISKLTKSGP